MPTRVRRPDKHFGEADECHYCRAALTPETKTIDHVVPVSRGGHKSDRRNRAAACEACNTAKGNGLTDCACRHCRRAELFHLARLDLMHADRAAPLRALYA